MKPLARDVVLLYMQSDKNSDGRGGKNYPGDNVCLPVGREYDEDGQP